MSDVMCFDNRVVVIFDAGAGPGRIQALDLARRGARVVVNQSSSGVYEPGSTGAAADQVVEEIVAMGGQAVANYDSRDNAEAIIQTAIDNFDRIDMVFNKSGVLRDTRFGGVYFDASGICKFDEKQR